MLRKISFGWILGSVLLLGACGTARVISQNQEGGVIELQGDRGKAMEQASSEMAAHCGPGNYRVVQQGEEVIGQDTFTREDTDAATKTSRSGRTTKAAATTTGQTSTREATAWRVHYACGGAAPGPAPGGPPPPPPPGGGGGAPPPPPTGY